MSRFFDIDLLAGVAAFAVAVAGVYLGELGELIDPRVAGGLAFVALGRWYARSRSE